MRVLGSPPCRGPALRASRECKRNDSRSRTSNRLTCERHLLCGDRAERPSDGTIEGRRTRPPCQATLRDRTATGRSDMKNPRLTACLLSLVLGASTAVALPSASLERFSDAVSTRDARDGHAREAHGENSRHRFNWRTFGESMLPPVLRTRAGVPRLMVDAVDSTSRSDECPLASEWESLTRIARRAADRLS